MSLDISLYDKDDDDIMSINWLRNPYGLERWAEASVFHVKLDFESEATLWQVCNENNYDKSEDIDRKRFQRVVWSYWEIIKNIETGFFFFRLGEFIQFIQPHYDRLPKRESAFGFVDIEGYEYEKPDRDRILIPMEHFKQDCFHLGIREDSVLQHYKNWFQELIQFAEYLQDESYTFHCSN